jgi:hypothetical protein
MSLTLNDNSVLGVAMLEMPSDPKPRFHHHGTARDWTLSFISVMQHVDCILDARVGQMQQCSILAGGVCVCCCCCCLTGFWVSRRDYGFENPSS